MQIEFQQAIQQLVKDQSLNLKEISRFTAVDFRLGIQYLVAEDHNDMAQALAEAGLALFPLSEDILAIAGLLAITREDWPHAIELLQDLVSLQKDKVQPLTCQMLARALACNLDIAEAHQVLDQAMKLWPDNSELADEKSAMPLTQDVLSAPTQFN